MVIAYREEVCQRRSVFSSAYVLGCANLEMILKGTSERRQYGIKKQEPLL